MKKTAINYESILKIIALFSIALQGTPLSASLFVQTAFQITTPSTSFFNQTALETLPPLFEDNESENEEKNIQPLKKTQTLSPKKEFVSGQNASKVSKSSPIKKITYEDLNKFLPFRNTDKWIPPGPLSKTTIGKEQSSYSWSSDQNEEKNIQPLKKPQTLSPKKEFVSGQNASKVSKSSPIKKITYEDPNKFLPFRNTDKWIPPGPLSKTTIGQEQSSYRLSSDQKEDEELSLLREKLRKNLKILAKIQNKYYIRTIILHNSCDLSKRDILANQRRCCIKK